MLTIIESYYDEPIRMMAKPGVRFEPGLIVRTIETDDGNTLCDLASGDNMRVIGIVGNHCYVDSLSYRMSDMVEVWAQKMIFRTDRYEPASKFTPGCPVYVGKNGWFTTKPKFEDMPCVAHVTMVPGENHEFFEANWL